MCVLDGGGSKTQFSSAWSLAERSAEAAAAAATERTLLNERQAKRGAIIIIIQLPPRHGATPPPRCHTAAPRCHGATPHCRLAVVTQRRSRRWTTLPPWFSSVRPLPPPCRRHCSTMSDVRVHIRCGSSCTHVLRAIHNQHFRHFFLLLLFDL